MNDPPIYSIRRLALCPEPRLVKDRAAFKRCLLRRFNQIRQVKQQPQYKTIKSFTRLINTENAEETYQVLLDAQNVKSWAWSNFGNTDEDDEGATKLNNLKKILNTYRGKDVWVFYKLDTGETLRDIFYHIPQSITDFNRWWDNKVWDWKVSNTNIFDDTQDGRVFISESGIITPQIATQLYLDNETGTCFTKPIRELCKQKDSKNYKTILNKCDKIEKKYPNGIPDDKLDEICNYLNIRCKINLPFEMSKSIYGKEKGLLTLEYINTRFNHLEIQGELFRKSKPIPLCYDEFKDLVMELDGYRNGYFTNDRTHYIYKRNNAGVYQVQTLTNTYILQNNYGDVFKAFEEKTGLKNCYLDDNQNELLCKFIRYGAKQTSSKTNEFIDDMKTHKAVFKEIDQIKAYTQFKQTTFYKGFVGKITDFRQTTKIQGNGYYLIKNIDWTNANKKLKEIQRSFKIFYGRNIYSNVELDFLQHYGATFIIVGGCWGVRTDFDFDETMLLKNNGIPNYSRWTGCKNSHEDTEYLYTQQDNLDFIQHLKTYNDNIQYFPNERVMRVGIKKETNKTLTHISGFIYAYQRINLIEQLLKMETDKVLKINVDGIKYIEHNFTINKTFTKIIEVKPNTLTNGEREGGFITQTNDNDFMDLFNFANHFKLTQERDHYQNELCLGAGGSGKTTYNLKDNGLINVVYVAPSYKLLAKMKCDYNCEVMVLANILAKKYDDDDDAENFKLDRIQRQYNTFVIDEASMVSENERQRIFELYNNCKLIFCGDVGFQALPVGDGAKEINIKSFESIRHFNKNYRCEDSNLLDLLNETRDAISSKKNINPSKLQHISLNECINIYDVRDIILVHKHETETKYNNLLQSDKYLVIKRNAIYNRGDIVYNADDISSKIVKKTHTFTTHSVQGETFREKIFIDSELLKNKRLFYTAISRAKFMTQIYIVRP